MKQRGEKTIIGLLPLYIKLYDDVAPDTRPRIDAFYKQIAYELEKRGLTVLMVPVCRIKDEFEAAVHSFEEGGAVAIVTLHLAYSPSLESAEVLAKTPLPIIVCDTTPTYSYSPSQEPEELMYNHGIHGVQDMCNLLLRNGKRFVIETGHWEKSDVLDRVVMHVQAARMCTFMRTAKIGSIGKSFKGMGDFFVTPKELKESIGAEVVSCDVKLLTKILDSITEDEVSAEVQKDCELFTVKGDIPEEEHKRSVRVGLAVRKWIEQKDLAGFTFNFLDITHDKGFETVPFLEASKQLAAGIGYGGEGDVLTALLIGTLLQGNPETSFSEMFCPDWEHDTVFVSHMGEMNYKLVEGKAQLLHMRYAYSDTGDPVFLCGRFKAGNFLLVNLAPVSGGYRLILSPCTMLPVKGKDRMAESIHGWFKPPMGVREFLKGYSEAGGTHHFAIAYNESLEKLVSFGRMMGFQTLIIE
ncbi:MAG TPA: hypothetical protein PLG43_01110 [Spirochaetia bacterium]|nr:hypothetical protein [Spirochaetia bacterium]